MTTDVVLHFLAPNRIGPVRAIVRTRRHARRRHGVARRGARRRRRPRHRARGRHIAHRRMTTRAPAACTPGRSTRRRSRTSRSPRPRCAPGALDRLDLADLADHARQGRRTPSVRSRHGSRCSNGSPVSRPWLGVIVTDAQLITDIAAGYDVVVMGADKWAQVRDPAWYDGSVAGARRRARAALAGARRAPRPGSRSSAPKCSKSPRISARCRRRQPGRAITS